MPHNDNPLSIDHAVEALEATPPSTTKANQLLSIMRALGASDPDSWVQSEFEENIPQLARFLVLRHLWSRTINRYRDKTSWIPSSIGQAERDPTGMFADAGLALRHMVDAGVNMQDIGNLARCIAYEAVFDVLDIIDDGYDGEARASDPTAPGWALMETDDQGELTGRQVSALHEDILIMDPSGREGRIE